MTNLLSKKDRRHLAILEILFDNNETSLSFLTETLDSSRKTIREDFDAINEFIQPMSIVTSYNGSHLVYPLHITRDFIYSRILTNSLEYSFLELIFFEQEKRLEDYAEALFTSVSKLRRIIKEVNAHSEKNHFKITTDPIQVIGDERSIENAMINFFKEKYPKMDYPFRKLEEQELTKLVNHAVGKQPKFLNLPDMNFLKLNLFVSLVRIQHGHYLHIPDDLDTSHYRASFLSDAIFTRSFKNIFHIELTKDTLIQLFFPFISGGFALSYEVALEIAKKDAKKALLIEETIRYLKVVTKTFGFDLTKDNQVFILEIFNLHALMLGDNYLLYDREKIFIKNMCHRSPAMTFFYQKNTPLILQHFTDLTKHDVARILYYLTTHLEEIVNLFRGSQPISKVGIFMDLSLEHTSFIRDFLESEDVGQFNFNTIMTNSLDDAIKQFSQYDAIVTNLSNLEHDSIPIIAISIFPTEKDFKRLKDFYYKLNPMPGQVY